jgi:Peptidase A4 family
MLSKRLGTLLALAIVPALAQTPSGPASSPTTSAVSPRQHAPRKVAGLRPDRVIGNITVSDSTTWAGYAVTGSSFTKALGSWTVPSVNCSRTPNTYSSFWVGIDGWSSATVEQTGTDSDCDGDSPSYYAWYEFYPAASVLISSVPVSPGNQMSASVSYSGTVFTIKITNETTGKSYSKSSKVSGAERSSAEWITNSGGTLADFDVVYSGDDYTGVSDTDYATDSSTSGPIGAFGTKIQEIDMVNGTTGACEAMTSPLTPDGTSFYVTWCSE